MEGTKDYKVTKTTDFLIKLNKFLFLCGLPNYWVEDLNFSENFNKLYRRVNTVGNICAIVLIISEFGAFFTQHNLTEKQTADLKFFTVAHVIVVLFRLRMSQQEPEIRGVMYKLGVQLKETYNDIDVEHLMIEKSTTSCIILTINCTLSVGLMLLEAGVKTVKNGDTFTTIITIIPDVNDNSAFSDCLRVMFNIFWLIHVSRVFSVYTVVICLVTTTSHQFKNLNSYFWSLNKVFEANQDSHEMSEEVYMEKFKTGIKLHAESLKCTNRIQTICGDIFNGQIIFNLVLLIVLMYQFMNSDRNLTNACAIVVSAASILLGTGLFMWNAGDITVEAEKIPTSMFCSGWENCCLKSSKRIRQLAVISMMQAQKPVVLTGFGLIPLSYQSYVSIVRSSYSVFSVVY